MAEKADKIERKWKNKSKAELTGCKLQTLQLKTLGWGPTQIATTLGISRVTVYKWLEDMENQLADMPEIQAAIDRVQTLIPQSVSVLENSLGSENEKIAQDTAVKILLSAKVLTDRKTLDHDDASKSTDDLVAEARRIIEGEVSET